MQTQEFENESYKTFHDIGMGITLINHNNFKIVHDLLPNGEAFLSNKDIFAKDLLSFLRYLDDKVTYSERDIDTFNDTPHNLNKRIMKGTSYDNALEESKDLMSIVNDLYGSYCVATNMISFLLKRDKVISTKHKELIKKYEEALIKLEEKTELENTKELELKELMKKDTSVLSNIVSDDDLQENDLSETDLPIE